MSRTPCADSADVYAWRASSSPATGWAYYHVLDGSFTCCGRVMRQEKGWQAQTYHDAADLVPLGTYKDLNQAKRLVRPRQRRGALRHSR